MTSFAEAHTPVLVHQTSLHDIVTIDSPEVSRAFYGELDGFPNTYEIRSVKPFHLYVQVLVPDTKASKNNISGIIIKEVEANGRVQEVARLLAKDAMWESMYEPFGGDSYRIGGTFEKDVDPGVYRIEVSTPDNVEKYVLAVGTVEDFGQIGYFETMKRLMEVKVFFGKSRFMIIQSPFIYVPLGVIVVIGGIIYIRRRLRNNQHTV